MLQDKELSLEEARKLGQMGEFVRDHPSIGDEDVFDALLGAMASGKPAPVDQTSDEAASED